MDKSPSTFPFLGGSHRKLGAQVRAPHRLRLLQQTMRQSKRRLLQPEERRQPPQQSATPPAVAVRHSVGRPNRLGLVSLFSRPHAGAEAVRISLTSRASFLKCCCFKARVLERQTFLSALIAPRRHMQYYE